MGAGRLEESSDADRSSHLLPEAMHAGGRRIWSSDERRPLWRRSEGYHRPSIDVRTASWVQSLTNLTWLFFEFGDRNGVQNGELPSRIQAYTCCWIMKTDMDFASIVWLITTYTNTPCIHGGMEKIGHAGFYPQYKLNRREEGGELKGRSNGTYLTLHSPLRWPPKSSLCRAPRKHGSRSAFSECRLSGSSLCFPSGFLPIISDEDTWEKVAGAACRSCLTAYNHFSDHTGFLNYLFPYLDSNSDSN